MRGAPPVAPAWHLVVVAAAKALAGLLVLRSGFYALSDDDFSRTVIAQGFAVAPRLDPSGTSWLPLPFWITGTGMAAFGRTLEVARGVAVLEGIASALLIHRAALWMGASAPSAMLGAIVATVIPTAAVLGVTAQPEALTAGLVVFGAAAAMQMDGSRRMQGAVALGAACLCRYEAWAAAGVFSLIFVIGAWKREAPSGWVLAGVAMTPALIWMLHGVSAHHDALFFLHRVATYRRAVGATETFWQSLTAYPLAMIRAELAVTLAGVLALILGARELRRGLLVVGGVLLFLIVGRLLDGAPTHHGERTLLPVFTILALAAVEAAARSIQISRTNAVGAGCVAILAVTTGRAPGSGESREAERHIGLAARIAVPAGARVLVDTPDYGYFAVMAAFGAPERAVPASRRDPREAAEPDPFASETALATRLAREHATWMVVEARHVPVAERIATVIERTPSFALLSLQPLP